MSLDLSDRERKTILTLILTTKIVDFGVKRFHLVREDSLRCFCALKLLRKLYLSLGKSLFVG